MNMRHFSTALLIVLTIAAGLHAQNAAPQTAPAALGDNAALIYWQAIAVMPREFSDAESAAIDDWSAAKNVGRSKLVEQIQPTLRLLRQGAAKQHADWGIDMSQGPHTLLPHLQQVRTLSRLGLAAATEAMHRNEPMEAAHIAIAVMRMARHLDSEGTLIEMLVQVAIESNAERWIARHAPQMAAEARKYLLEQLDHLPPAATTASAMHGEKLFLDWTRRELEAGKLQATLRDLGAGESLDVDDLVKADPQTLLKWLDQAEKLYDEAAAVAAMPYPKVEQRLTRLLQQVKGGDNLLAKIFFPAIERVWQVDHASRARLALLRAGLQRLEGAHELPSDPYGDGKFKLIEHPQGLTLQSSLRYNDKPVELTFGVAPEKVMLGTPAPDFELADLGGDRVRLSSLRGQVVVLDFWATWCGPCVKGLPVVASVVDDFRGRGHQVALLAVNQKETAAQVQRFLQDRDLSLRVLLDTDRAVARVYDVEAIPHTVIVDRDGKIAAVHVGFSDALAVKLKDELQSLVSSGGN